MELRHHAGLSFAGPRVRTPLTRRLVARTRRRRLDEALAGGADPTTDPLLACRAQQLTSPHIRHQLADSLRDLVARSERPGRVSAAAPIAPSVRKRRSALLELADRLDDNGAVFARGVAAANLLITDGASPLWVRSTPEELGDAVEAALIGLRA